MSHPLVGFDYADYRSSELRVETLLNRMGYRHMVVWTSDGDSFGPCVRTISITNPAGDHEEASYG